MAALIRSLKRFVRAQSGAEVIEFALTLPLLLLVVLGIIEFGFLFQQYEVVTNAAREGARIAVLPTYSTNATVTQTNVTARVNQYLTAGGLGSASAICGGGGTCPGDWLPVIDTIVTGPPCLAVKVFRVTVEYQHPVAFLGGILSYFGKSVGNAGVITLRATSRMRNEVPASACS